MAVDFSFFFLNWNCPVRDGLFCWFSAIFTLFLTLVWLRDFPRVPAIRGNSLVQLLSILLNLNCCSFSWGMDPLVLDKTLGDVLTYVTKCLVSLLIFAKLWISNKGVFICKSKSFINALATVNSIWLYVLEKLSVLKELVSVQLCSLSLK